MKTTIKLLLLCCPVMAVAQMLEVGGVAAAPDDWLLGQGQKWHYRSSVSDDTDKLAAREPVGDEAAVVQRAKAMLESTSAKGMALVDGNRVVWAGYKAPASEKSLFLSFSVGKTVTSMAIGKAICAQKLSLDDRVDRVASEFSDSDIGKASVRDLLKMSSGTSPINHDSTITTAAQDNDRRAGKISWLDILTSPKLTKASENVFGAKRAPGETFDYHSTDPLVLGVLLNKATGSTYAKWVEREVLIPSGIKNPAVIGQDHFGFGDADGNIRLTLMDWVRFANWVKANEAGSDCFAQYVKDATKTQIVNAQKREGKTFGGYGYLIWTENNRLKDSYWAVGYGGQRIAWNHQNKRMLVAFSNVENYMDDLNRLYAEWAELPSKD